MAKITLKRPDFYGKSYPPNVVNSNRLNKSVMSRRFDFHQQKSLTQTPEVEAAIRAALFAYFPGLLEVHLAHLENDKRGVDYWLEFPGKLQALDVKIRTQDYAMKGDPDNVCLELVANIGSGKPGWVLDPDKLTDWVLVYYKDSGRSYIYPFQLLQAAVMKDMDKWKQAKQRITRQITKTLTGEYASESMFKSHRDLYAAMYHHSQKPPLETEAG